VIFPTLENASNRWKCSVKRSQQWGTGMSENRKSLINLNGGLTRRSALKGLGAAAGLVAAPGFVRYGQAQSSEPIKVGFQCHRTGIGAA
jgi:branched-chain amino acid transport system substrate-binding protein